MRNFTIEMKFRTLDNGTTVFCYYAQTKYKKDILQSWGNTEEECIQELFEAVDFEKSFS